MANERRKFLKTLGIGAAAVVTAPFILKPEDEAKADFDIEKEWPDNIAKVTIDGRAYVISDGQKLVPKGRMKVLTVEDKD